MFAWPALAGTAIAACLMIIVLMVGSQSDSVLPGSALYDVKLLSEQGQGLLMAAAGDDAQWQAQLADRRLSELQTLESTGQSVTAGQVERLADQVDAALLAGASLPEDDQAQLYASLQRDLDEATRTLDTGGDALTALYRVQAALAARQGWGARRCRQPVRNARSARSTRRPNRMRWPRCLPRLRRCRLPRRRVWRPSPKRKRLRPPRLRQGTPKVRNRKLLRPPR